MYLFSLLTVNDSLWMLCDRAITNYARSHGFSFTFRWMKSQHCFHHYIVEQKSNQMESQVVKVTFNQTNHYYKTFSSWAAILRIQSCLVSDENRSSSNFGQSSHHQKDIIKTTKTKMRCADDEYQSWSYHVKFEFDAGVKVF
jgi:hypothetical protein